MIDKTKHTHSINHVCEKILNEIQCDFVGFAFQERVGPDIRWLVAAGNNNEKYKLISVRYGKGIAGRVISTGRPIIIEGFPNNILGKALEYPIMLAEKLVYSYAVPVNYKGVSKGVLLVGQRTNAPLSNVEQEIVQTAALTIEEIMST